MAQRSSADGARDAALLCLQLGYWQGAIERCTNQGATSPNHIRWLAETYGPAAHVSLDNVREAHETAKDLTGGQGVAEVAVLCLRSGNESLAWKGLESTINVARKQHGVLVAWHPTSILELAEFAANKGQLRYAIELTNIALGHRSVYASLFDVERLANLLLSTGAPRALWADWCAIFVFHIQFAAHRPAWLTTLSDPKAVLWAEREDAASEAVLGRVLDRGPPGLLSILEGVATQFNAPAFAAVLRERFGGAGASEPSSSCAVQSTWWDVGCLQFRHYWHDMLASHEQAFLRNGDWAMFNTPTADYSMALAQWWRTLESVLKGAVARELSHLFQLHPDWVAWDRVNLSDAQQKKEEVFIGKLAEPRRAEQMTLGDLLLVLKKCMGDPDGRKAKGSRLRLEACKHLAKYDAQLTPLMQEGWLQPNCLTNENISWFRNRASHDVCIVDTDAFVGRIVARRILDSFYGTVLKTWGFLPTIQV